MRLSRTATVLAVTILSAATAGAQDDDTVVIDRGTEPLLSEAASRLRAELESGGSAARIDECAPVFDVECPSSGATPRAAVEFIRRGERVTVELRVWDQRQRSIVLRRADVPVPKHDASSTLALAALDLYRSTTDQLLPRAERPASRPTPRARPRTAPVAPRAAPHQERALDFTLGAVALLSVDELGPAFGPFLQVGASISQHWSLRLDVMGPLFSRDVSDSAGSAALRQELATFSGVWRSELTRRVPVSVALGAGAYHLQVSGRGTAEVPGRSESFWAFVGKAEAQMGYRVHRHLDFIVMAGAIATHSRAIILLGPTESGSVGQPSLLFGVGAVVH
jgi:hypothetical protein